jgi:hypothetical protein
MAERMVKECLQDQKVLNVKGIKSKQREPITVVAGEKLH